MKKTLLAFAAAGLMAAPVFAQPTLNISLGVRETGTAVNIGENGGTAGGIEWVGLNGQTLVLDGTWQQFTFDFDQLPITPFAGATADGILSSATGKGTIEHIRIDKNPGFSGRTTLWIDDVANSVDPPGPPPPVNTVFGTFEGYPSNTEVMFQEPGFSGSTAAFLKPTPNFAGVDNTVAHSGSASYRVEYKFANSNNNNWLRLTTFSAGTIAQPNPTIQWTDDGIVTFWMMGVPEPTSLVLLAVSSLAVLRRRR